MRSPFQLLPGLLILSQRNSLAIADPFPLPEALPAADAFPQPTAIAPLEVRAAEPIAYPEAEAVPQSYYAFSGAVYIVDAGGQTLNAASPAYCPNQAPQGAALPEILAHGPRAITPQWAVVQPDNHVPAVLKGWSVSFIKLPTLVSRVLAVPEPQEYNNKQSPKTVAMNHSTVVLVYLPHRLAGIQTEPTTITMLSIDQYSSPPAFHSRQATRKKKIAILQKDNATLKDEINKLEDRYDKLGQAYIREFESTVAGISAGSGRYLCCG
ncbi:hypothetical protein E2P81_ATG00677 [Venturia nashicola]|uniref:Uncharacterized protein n=1 Tax=Venturia nashicola TaxID=86259 RepID=A0A4Z1PWW4_9PEZI|nr:hypothetical protein E6O75_ATG00687 [Venturia nashicola]TLD39690.1 hypothetical protein E2P81_ATG00677 [Venturia nashicola]